MKRFVAPIALLAALSLPAVAQDPPPADATIVPVDRSEADRLLERALDGWSARRERLKTVEYALKGDDRHTKGGQNRVPGQGIAPRVGQVPSQNYATSVECRLWLDFEARRVRYERSGGVLRVGRNPEFLPRHRIGIRDGNRFVRHEPKARQPLADPAPEFDYDWGGSLFDPDVAPLLHAHGHVTQAACNSGGFAVLPSADDFIVVGIEFRDGRNCLVLDTRRPGWRLWVDLEREAALLRTRKDFGGRPVMETSAEYVFAENVWMPRRWTWSHAPGVPARVVTHSVVSRTTDPDLTGVNFWPEPQPGDEFKKSHKRWRHQGPDLPPLPLPDGPADPAPQPEA